MPRFLLYAACAAAVVLAIWLVLGTRESGDSLSGATQTSGTQMRDTRGVGAEAPAIAPDTPEDAGAIDPEPGAAAPPPPDLPRTLRSLGEEEPPAQEQDAGPAP